MNNIHNNRVGYMSKISKNILPVFLLALFLSSGLFLTSCSDPITPIEEKKIDKVEDSFNQNVNNNVKSIYTLSTFKKNAGNSEVVNLNESINFNNFAQYHIQIKDFKTNSWVDLEIDSQDGDVSHLKPKKKFTENDVYTPKPSIIKIDLKHYKFIKIKLNSDFKNNNNEYELRILEYAKSNTSNYNSSIAIDDNYNLIEVERFENLSEYEAKIKNKEFQ